MALLSTKDFRSQKVKNTVRLDILCRLRDSDHSVFSPCDYFSFKLIPVFVFFIQIIYTCIITFCMLKLICIL